MTKKRISIVLICLIILIICIYILSHILRPKFMDDYNKVIDYFHSMPNNSFEVIGYGNSHIWKDMNPIYMYEKYGIGVYNYGLDWQGINTTLLFLKESLLTQSPKVVIIETYAVNEVHIASEVDGELYYTRRLKEFDGKRNYLKQRFGKKLENYFAYYVPLYSFHTNWTNITDKIDLKFTYKEYMGANLSDEVKEIKNLKYYDENNQCDIDYESMKILNEIIYLSKKYNFNVIFITTPFSKEEDYFNFCYNDALEKFASENNAVYIDFMKKIDELNIDSKTDFRDEGHLNIYGANKISDYLGKYIKEHYNVTDMRKVNNNLWDKTLKKS